MPYNGSGTFVSLAPPNFPAVPGQTISASAFNANLNDVFGGLTLALTRDGQSSMQANLPMGNNRLVNVADPVNAQDGSTKSWTEANFFGLAGGSINGPAILSGGSFTINNNLPFRFANAANNAYFTHQVAVNDDYSLTNPASVVVLFAEEGATPIVRFGAGSNNRLTFDGSANTATMRVNGIDSLHVNNAGRIGIGNTAPGQSLDVTGGIRARSGAPGAAGVNNNGYTFSGALDSGLFSLVDNQVSIYSDGAEMLRATATGVSVYNGISLERVGYRNLPVAATPTPGECMPITANRTIDVGTAGELISFYNNSAGSLTLTQGAGVTLRLNGTATSGNRTLLQRGMVSLWYFTNSEVIAIGNVT